MDHELDVKEGIPAPKPGRDMVMLKGCHYDSESRPTIFCGCAPNHNASNYKPIDLFDTTQHGLFDACAKLSPSCVYKSVVFHERYCACSNVYKRRQHFQ